MTVTIDTIRLFELLKPKLGAEESKAVVQALEAIPTVVEKEVAKQVEISKKDLATKGDIFSLKEDILAIHEDMHRVEQKISSLEVRMHEKFNSQLIWLVSTIFAATGLAIAILKLS